MPYDWDVEAALEEVADAINDGTARLDLDPETRKLVKDLYRDDFAARTKEQWEADKKAILEMARKAGSCAETATIVLWVNGIGTVGKHLDQETTLLVCVTVSRLYCTLEKGAWCQNVDYSKAKGKILDEILKEI